MLATGIYEKLITQLIENELSKHTDKQFFVERQKLEPADAAIYLARFLQQILYLILDSLPAKEDEDRVSQQIEFSNAFIYWLRDYLEDEGLTENILDANGHMLRALYSTQNPIAKDLSAHVAKITPLTGLSQSELFTGSNAGLSLDSELRREILSADEIWWLVSFIKWSGIRIFSDELKQFTASGRKLRIITTSYMGATDQKAVNFLGELPNTEVKLSYNIKHERLHAKSYLFLRDSGFDTGYIGSANISKSALTNGLEWNLKVTTQEIPHILEKFKSTFETYWESPEFERYCPRNESERERLKTALVTARGDTHDEIPLFFDLEPHNYQKLILEKLHAERFVHNRWRNLIVAATGTGKTIMAAFDFHRFMTEHPGAKLLFVAHREEILRHARKTFQAVLRDSSFGELWVGGETPANFNQLFASVQTLNNQIDTMNLTNDFYDMIIIDEVHHITAASYRPILQHFNPRVLLGLTATPERRDEASILEDFCDTIAAEIRLPDAINCGYLCPFQYFCVDDIVDLSTVAWKQGRYVPAELSRIYTQNDNRVFHILRNMEDILSDINSIKCMAFCATQDHAEYMAKKFLLNNVKSAALTSRNRSERSALLNQLTTGQINVLFVVDMFNEGVDVPEINTILFLRPTESLTIFLQQLGRGLRLAAGKECLTVLDFVGNSRAEYDFGSIFRSIIGKSHTSIAEEIENDFPHLPLGCSIVLQKQSREIILNNIRRAVINQQRLLSMIRGYEQQTSAQLTLPNFLHQFPAVTLEDIYKTSSWTRLCIKAGKLPDTANKAADQAIFKGISNRILQCTSSSYLQFLLNLSQSKGKWNSRDETQNKLAMMVHYDFWQAPGGKFGFKTIEESLAALTEDSHLNQELSDTVQSVMERVDTEEIYTPAIDFSALRLHARYSRDEILASFGVHTFEKKGSSREGVLYIKELDTELLFVTLQKTDSHFSPTTLYHDYAISDTLFHWQSQNSARPDKGQGKSYVNHKNSGKTIMLFVRERSTDEYKRTMGFINLGPVTLQSHHGSQPMNIIWKLHTPLPALLWKEAAKLAVG